MRTRIFAMMVGLAGLLACAHPAHAQFFGIPVGGAWGGFGGGRGGWPGTSGGGGVGAPAGVYTPFYGSTPFGDPLYGTAAITSAAGQAALNTSIGSVYVQEAYQHWIENTKLATQAYIDNRKAIGSFRAEMRIPPPTPEQVISFNKARLPDRLTPDQLDQERGQIKWPQVLLRDEFATERAALEYLFAERSARPYSTGLGTQNYREIRRVTDDLHDVLRSLIDQITADEFIAGNKFINSVAYEGRFEPDTSLAKN